MKKEAAVALFRRRDELAHLEANLMLPVGDGGDVRVEVHNLIEDQIIQKAKFDLDEDAHVDEDEVLAKIRSAIDGFNKQVT